MIQETLLPVKVELEQTRINDMPILFIKDTAVTTGAIQEVLGKGFGELMQFVQANQLKAEKVMTWYYAAQAPWPMDIAVETNSIPAQLSGRIQSKLLKAGDVIIAHMWGPYDQAGVAYTKIANWLKSNKRKAKAAPFEVYLNDPATLKSPSEIRTDIYQLIE